MWIEIEFIVYFIYSVDFFNITMQYYQTIVMIIVFESAYLSLIPLVSELIMHQSIWCQTSDKSYHSKG